MSNRVNRNHQALKHGAYSATAVLPGESRAAFQKLHRALIDEISPSGLLENDIVADMARLVWRKQNLGTLRIAERAQDRWLNTFVPEQKYDMDLRFGMTAEELDQQEGEQEEEIRVGRDRVRKELGDDFEFVKIGEAATLTGLTEELDVKERLDTLIDRCLKRLLLVRGVKSIAAAPPSVPPKQIPGPSEDA